MSTSENPFASPRTAEAVTAEVLPEVADAERIRKQYLNHETSLRSIGLLYYLGIAVLVLSAVPILANSRKEIPPAAQVGYFAGFAVVYLIVLAIQFFIARGLRRLDPRVRIPLTIFSVLGMISFPFGTLINAYILYLVWSRKGKIVFSPDYKQVMLQTPHVRYKISIIVWIAVGLLVIVLGLGLVGFVATQFAGK